MIIEKFMLISIATGLDYTNIESQCRPYTFQKGIGLWEIESGGTYLT